MSVLRYTFASAVLQREMMMILTLPEATEGEKPPFAAAVLLPDVSKESDFLLRRESLERYCGTLIATVSLPGQITLQQASTLVRFLTEELPGVLNQFPITPCALFAEGHSASNLSRIENALRNTYPTLQWNGSVEALILQMKTKEGLP